MTTRRDDGGEKPCGIEIVTAYQAGNKAAVELMLAKFPAKERAGLRAILAIRDDQDALRKKLISLGFSPQNVDPMPIFP